MQALGSRKKYLAIAGLSLVILLVISAGLFLYNFNLQQDLNSNACDSMNELIYHQQRVLQARMEGNITYMKSLAKTVSRLPKDAKRIEDVLKLAQQDSPFCYILMTDISGQGYSSEGVEVEISGQPYFEELLEGTVFFSEPVLSALDGKTPVIPVSAPIYTGEKITGLLVGAYNINRLQELLTAPSKGKNICYITDKDGNIIANSGDNLLNFSSDQSVLSRNLIDLLAQVQIEGHDQTKEISTRIQNKEAGHSYLNIQGVHWFMHYAPVELKDWHFFMMVPESVIIAQAQSITGDVVILTLSVLGVCSLLLWYIIWLQQKSAKEKRRYTEELERIAYYDDLTGLPNLYRFKQLAGERLKAHPAGQLLLCKFDIINFKAVNEIFGFEVGNEMLRLVAQLILDLQKEKIHDKMICCRISGDEFATLDRVESGMEDSAAQMQRFERLFQERAKALVGNHTVLFQFGRYFVEKSEMDIDVAIEKANLAHRVSKKQKGVNFCNYDTALRTQFMRRLELESKMAEALREQVFQVYLQPKFDLKTETAVGAEALVRWRDKDGITIFPNEFIPLFEKNGLITKLDMYMLESTCSLLREWIDSGQKVVPISINFSRLHLYNLNFVEDIKAVTAKYNIPKQYIEIELTESVFFENEEALEELLMEVHNGGFTLSMDDFGSGYSSLGLLKNLPVDVIKIDRSFFMANKYKTRAKAVIETVIEMARKLGIKTVAEGVETLEHIALLREVGCDIVQGYYYARPVPAANFYEAIRAAEQAALQGHEEGL